MDTPPETPPKTFPADLPIRLFFLPEMGAARPSARRGPAAGGPRPRDRRRGLRCGGRRHPGTRGLLRCGVSLPGWGRGAAVSGNNLQGLSPYFVPASEPLHPSRFGMRGGGSGSRSDPASFAAQCWIRNPRWAGEKTSGGDRRRAAGSSVHLCGGPGRGAAPPATSAADPSATGPAIRPGPGSL